MEQGVKERICRRWSREKGDDTTEKGKGVVRRMNICWQSIIVSYTCVVLTLRSV